MSLINKYMVDIPPDIQKSIRMASQITGAPEDYLKRVAALESSNDPNARNAKSSARGLFQVIDQTAAQIQKEHPERDLSNRFDPNTSAEIAGYLAQRDRELLSRGKRPVEDWMVYGAHRLGGGGFNTVQNNPNAIARDLLPEAAAANWSTFYDPQGTPRTGSQVSSLLKNKYNTVDTSLFSKGPAINTESMFSQSLPWETPKPYNITFNDRNTYSPYIRQSEPTYVASSPTYSSSERYLPGILPSETSISLSRPTPRPSSSYGSGPSIGFSGSSDRPYVPSDSFAEKYWKGGTSFSDQ